jgi:hypothetical protein
MGKVVGSCAATRVGLFSIVPDSGCFHEPEPQRGDEDREY